MAMVAAQPKKNSDDEGGDEAQTRTTNKQQLDQDPRQQKANDCAQDQ